MELGQRYIYLGDRLTSNEHQGAVCFAVLRDDGKCTRGRNGSMLVCLDSGKLMTVIGRLLRKRDN